MRILLPNTRVQHFKFPIVFLAGPIRGAPEWHKEAIEYLQSACRGQDLTIASPSRNIPEWAKQYVLREGAGRDFPRQRAWERNYIDIASDDPSKQGALLFWLPERLPKEENPYWDKPYASMTRIELGTAIGRFDKTGLTKFCIGSTGRFQDLDAIEDDLRYYAPRPIYDTLEKTCDEAIRLAYQEIA